jgi:hypothetical protein
VLYWCRGREFEIEAGGLQFCFAGWQTGKQASRQEGSCAAAVGILVIHEPTRWVLVLHLRLHLQITMGVLETGVPGWALGSGFLALVAYGN